MAWQMGSDMNGLVKKKKPTDFSFISLFGESGGSPYIGRLLSSSLLIDIHVSLLLCKDAYL